MLTEYQQQAKTFLESNGLKLRISVYPPDMQRAPRWAVSESGQRVERHGLRYRVTLTRSGKPGQLSFDFWDSIHNRELLEKRGGRPGDAGKLDSYSVLACISSDQFCADTFADFCDELGFDRDSRKALRTFKRCRSFAKRINRFFTESELSALSDIQ